MLDALFMTLYLGVLFTVGPVLASWLALGSSALHLRLGVAIAGACLLGCAWCDRYSTGLSQLAGVLLIAGCLVAAARPGPVEIAITSVLLSPLVVGLVYRLVSYPLDRASSARVGGTLLVVFLSASALSVWRVFGYRVLPLLDEASDEDLERGTGKGLDEWLETLLTVCGRDGTHAVIRAELRSRGLDDYWQRTVTEAAERALGRIEVGAAGPKRLVVIAPDELKNARSLVGYPYRQLTFRQLLTVTLCAAAVSVVLRQFRWDSITPALLVSGLIAFMDFTVVGWLFVWGALSIRRFEESLTVAWFCGLAVVLASLFVLLRGVGGGFSAGWLLGVVAIVAGGYLTLGLILLRRRGYRLVRLAALRDGS